MTDFSNLPNGNTDSSDSTREFYDKYFVESIAYPSNQVDAVVGFFEKRGFDKVAATSVASVLLYQAKVDKVNIFTLLDTLRGYEKRELSTLVTQIININRSKISTLGFRNTDRQTPDEIRNIKH